ncbi:hypothetical protein M404DRAFT_1003292 [Pisolithus tinctorius Marx 270]|uniref:Uncharacterized protein n=1 Tax=Pisolithus tinctorius Marx 270 TaxID=870435 RepID=A0A0C3P0G6_PISTI|nr:hypothetical protein M404DRAFT_1003292 [Pisolithus tinctorius Marx 270]
MGHWDRDWQYKRSCNYPVHLGGCALFCCLPNHIRVFLWVSGATECGKGWGFGGCKRGPVKVDVRI